MIGLAITASLGIGMAVTGQAETLKQASCELAPVGAEWHFTGPQGFEVSCPVHLPDLQTFADDLLARIPTGFERQRYIAYTISETIDFQRPAGGDWQAVPGQIIVHLNPQFSPSVVGRGAQHMLCAVGLRPDPSGQPRNITANCCSEVRGVTDRMERSAIRTAANWRLLPVDMAYCLDEQVYVKATINGRVADPATMPDPARLPPAC